MVSFEQLFQTTDSDRDKFLSRLFGIFNEEPVRIWCRQPGSPYEDLGRPTLTPPDGSRGSTLDFCLRRKSDAKTFVAEMKCELQYENYRCLTLTDAGQLDHHTGLAFQRFLQSARNPATFKVTVASQPIAVDGAILVWGNVSDEGRASVMTETGVADVLSLAQIINDLIQADNEEYRQFIQRRANWCNQLFAGLLGAN